MPSFSNSLEASIHKALTLANSRKHELATLEHLLLALLTEVDAARVLTACDVDIEKLERAIVKYLDSELGTLVTEVDGAEAVPTTGF